ncbi:AIPR family protein [Paraliomyxa miuraensis]|uniref:AIPR family protein n=1 Tax=Paraliomyxa miuraensis TaxID=376150 RepID=UPI00225923E1|nr:AIPR family protein [Paraliomyxa miuraensis]MCX4245994.1 AIPR family protein [Paraliomyxa miuraensis]
MSFAVGIIDQQVRGLATRLHDRMEALLEKKVDETLGRSIAFVVLCVKAVLDLDDDDALDRLTEGGNDFGVDALDVSDVSEGEFTVTLFQGKYKHENLDGQAHFPEDGVAKAVAAIRALFNPHAPVDLNPRLLAHVEEIRSLIVDGYIPRVRFLLCNNGLPWQRPVAQRIIDREGFPANRVQFEHVNHDTLFQILQSTQPVDETIQFSGKAVVEDFDFSRVFLGKVTVGEIARLMQTHGDRLLERNVRRYLGMHGNRVNLGIRSTLCNEEERPSFFFYNNGITLICRQFSHNALQPADHEVRVEGLQIINGGQTCKTIQATLAELGPDAPRLDDAFVLVRLYQITGDDSKSFVHTITYATNSQNPVDLRDLRSNDPIQKQLELAMKDLGYEYRRQRSESGTRPGDVITSGIAATAVLSVWRRRPQQAKFMSGEHFGRLYDEIFGHELNAAQAIVAVLLFRIAESKRKRPPWRAPDFVRYASHFAAMLMGKLLLRDLGIGLDRLDHRSFAQAKALIDERGEEYFRLATLVIGAGLESLYGRMDIGFQRLSSLFRHGELLLVLDRDEAIDPMVLKELLAKDAAKTTRTHDLVDS